MESDAVRLVRRLWELFNSLPTDPRARAESAELAELLRLFDAHVEFVQGGPQADADRFKGREALADIWADWLGTWAAQRSEIEDLRARGNRVLVLSRESFTGRDDLHGETEGASIVTVASGRVVRLETFLSDRAAALEAFERPVAGH